MGKLSKEARQKLKAELNRIAKEMLLEEDPAKLKLLKERYDVIFDLLKTDWKVSPDTLVIVGANLLGIILILKFEQLDIITTKALSFVMKGRV
jgi:hypothetical protein